MMNTRLILMMAVMLGGAHMAMARVDVDLSVLDQTVPSVAVMPAEGDFSGVRAADDLEALRRKYKTYPFTSDTSKSEDSEVSSKAAFVAIPAPVVKPVPLLAEPEIEAEKLSEPEVAAVEPVIVEESFPAEESFAAMEDDDTIYAEPSDISLPLPDQAVPIDDMDLATALGQDPAVELSGEEPIAVEDNVETVDEAVVSDKVIVTAVGYKGDDIRLDPPVEQALINDFIPQIKAQPDLRLGLYAYASSAERGERKARRLSLSRALELRSFLIDSGIKPERIDLFPLGDEAEEGSYKDRIDLILQP